MKVLINGRYAYETDLEDVEVGDEMVLPGTLSADAWTGVVTALEPAYEGHCRKVIGLSRRRAQVEAEQKALAEVEITGWKVGDTFSKPCRECKEDRVYSIKQVNSLGRPTSVAADTCKCGALGSNAGLGPADAFRHFVISSDW
ncbi:MAG: hypothetical protein ACJ76B_09420 [Solirubrobacterales bacterium]